MEIWFSSVAKEDLVNNSVYIKDFDGVRNIRHYLEIHSELCVFVSNIMPESNESSDKAVISKGSDVRCLKVRI